MPANVFLPLSRHGRLPIFCLQNMKSSDAAFTNTQILGHSAAKFVIYLVTEYSRCAPDNVSTLVGMGILGHSTKFPKLPRVSFFSSDVERRIHTFSAHETRNIRDLTAQKCPNFGQGRRRSAIWWQHGAAVQFFFPRFSYAGVLHRKKRNLMSDAAHHAVDVPGVSYYLPLTHDNWTTESQGEFPPSCHFPWEFLGACTPPMTR